MGFAEAEPPGKLTRVGVEGGFVTRLAMDVKLVVDGGVAEFPGQDKAPQGGSRVTARLAYGSIGCPPEALGAGGKNQFGGLGLLGRQVHRQHQGAFGAAAMVVAQDGIVIKRQGVAQPPVPQPQVMGLGVRPPLIEHAVQRGAEKSVVEPQTEAGGAQSNGPYLGVLAVAPFVSASPLLCEQFGDRTMRPRERIVTIADHVKRLFPFRIA